MGAGKSEGCVRPEWSTAMAAPKAPTNLSSGLNHTSQTRAAVRATQKKGPHKAGPFPTPALCGAGGGIL